MSDNILTINELYRMLNIWSRRVRDTDSVIDRYHGAQRFLLAYLSLDLLLDEDGFVLLIASGRAEHALSEQLAEELRQWGAQHTPGIIKQARSLYQQHGAAIREAADRGDNIETIRKQFPQFDSLDETYCLICEEDFSTVCSYVRRHPADFADLVTAAGPVGSPIPPLNEAPALSRSAKP